MLDVNAYVSADVHLSASPRHAVSSLHSTACEEQVVKQKPHSTMAECLPKNSQERGVFQGRETTDVRTNPTASQEQAYKLGVSTHTVKRKRGLRAADLDLHQSNAQNSTEL